MMTMFGIGYWWLTKIVHCCRLLLMSTNIVDGGLILMHMCTLLVHQIIVSADKCNGRLM